MRLTRLEVLFTPAEFATLGGRDLRRATTVVLDVLRASTSMIAALANGARAILPVAEIAEALALKHQRPDLLLAGERQGVRIRAHLTGGQDFDLGNSPREFTPEAVAGRTIVMTTTNGTRALRAAAGSAHVLVAAFLNLGATIRWLRAEKPAELILVCSGTHEEAALEDALAAGALADQLWELYESGQVADSVRIARALYRGGETDLAAVVAQARNARRLLQHADLRDDVAYSLQRDTQSFVAAQGADGLVRRID